MPGALQRWWRQLWPSPEPPGPAAGPRPGAGGSVEEPSPVPGRRRYTAPPRDDDPRREAHLGAVLQALAGGSLTRRELGDRVGAADWGPGRLDVVVAHGVASGVLLADDDVVRARYAD